MPNFIEIGQASLEINVTKFLYTLQYFSSPGGPPGPRVTSLGRGVHLATGKISSSSDDPSTRYLLAKLVDFVVGVSDPQTNKKQTHTHTVNDMSPHNMQRQ